jgi:hypothetical protein
MGGRSGACPGRRMRLPSQFVFGGQKIGDLGGAACMAPAGFGGPVPRPILSQPTAVTPLDGAAAPTRQPHRLAGDGVGGIACRRPGHRVGALIRAGYLERIPSPLTLGGELGKRWSAQR